MSTSSRRYSRWFDVAFYMLFAVSAATSLVLMNEVAGSKALYFSYWRIPVMILAALSGFAVATVGFTIVNGIIRFREGLTFLPFRVRRWRRVS